MEALAETPIPTLGRTKIATDQVEDLITPRGGVLRMEPEKGKPIVFTAIADRREAMALSVLFSWLRDAGSECAAKLAAEVQDEVDAQVSWDHLATRFERAAGAF